MKQTVLVFYFVLLSLIQSFAQMRAPEEWLNYETVMGVKNNQRLYDFDVTCIRTSSPANIFWPGEKATFTFQLVNNTNTAISVDAKVELINYGSKGIPNDIWLPEMFKIAEIQSISLKINVAANGFVDIDVEPKLPEIFGGYAIVFDLGKQGRRLASSVVRTFKPTPTAIQYPKQALDDLGADFLSRIGVQAIRMGISYIPTTHRDYVSEMEKLNRKLKEYKDKNITVLLMFMEGPALIPLGNPRSFLDDKNVFLKTKQDYVWLPELDNDFQKFVKNICTNNGWPKGCVTGVHLWNEPWEGISISGWQSDMLRYREIYTAMANGVLEARKEGADVLIGGCDSNSNAWDKLFSDGKMDFLPIFDFLSIHYQGMESPCLYPQWNNRKDHKGRVLIWDTESWVGNTDDRIATVVATNRSAGYDRSMGIYGGYMISREHSGAKQRIRTKDGGKQIEAIPSVWSPAAAMGAVQHNIGERDFKELLFKNGLPWVMSFEGYKNNPDDGTVVVIGDIGEAFGAENVLFRDVRGLNEIAKKDEMRRKLAELPSDSHERKDLLRKLGEYNALTNGKMTINDDPTFTLYDFYGNPVATKENKIVIPLTFQGYFLRTDGSKGSYARLISALKKGKIEGYEPVEIVAKDMVRRIEQKPIMELQITNILNRPVSGILNVKLGGLELNAPQSLTMKANETKTLQVQITGGKTSPDNTYPLEVLFDAGKDGKASHEENMHVNVISRRTPIIDGKLDEWTNTFPLTVTAGKASLSVTEAAWYPFKQFDTKAEGMANGYLAYDEQYFYFAAKVADNTPHPGTYRFETRNDDEFFYPDVAYKPDANLSFRKKDGKRDANENDQSALQHPTGAGRIMSYWEPDANNIGFGIDLNLPSDKATQVAFYLPNIDTQKTLVDVFDLNTNALLLSQSCNKLWDGCYLVFELSGNVRVTFKGDWWYNVKLAGVFFDKTITCTNNVTSAFFVKEDFDTKGNWKNVYGKEGYWVFGSEPKMPAGIPANATDTNVLIPLKWPEGVRLFSYRKDPVLPDNSSGLGFASDNVQIAFNVIPIGDDGYGSTAKGTMPRYIGYKCTDYEYALNQVAPEYGGGTEIWRLLVPGMPEKHFYPRQPKSPFDGAVKNGKLAITHEGSTRITECAIPWSELPDVKKALDEGKTIKFSFRVNDDANGGACMELSRDRSVSKKNSRAFHASWKEHWANEVEFGVEK
ncbi:MAG: hypothetical protein AUK44_02275 [Porphyromonadaceae bacterium CG2_30_38_12]|nr:MAG: hypothetical protein AUK44_02275 [Porphyromonadaceae bacterium CG2_30_38_12]